MVRLVDVFTREIVKLVDVFTKRVVKPVISSPGVHLQLVVVELVYVVHQGLVDVFTRDWLIWTG
ncbi:hypothetical protein Sjap_005787 [Stephania japonica]|uniref:Uncharacterized protein n=1 Tax=Stephania japonica TaxID=461633 RepID=A0AAP0PKF8_9MAGN